MAVSLHSIGIISIGDMGLGIAQLLIAHQYRVVTFAADRSETTQQRAASAGVELLSSFDEVVRQADCILSIVPPKDALDTARRVESGLRSRAPGQTPLYFLELNATSPQSARETAEVFTDVPSQIIFIDGGIIGIPPHLVNSEWKRPALVLSGHVQLPDARLSEILYIRHVGDDIGTASGLKMCFASLTKGLTAIAIQSFTTAHALGTLPELRDLMREYNPNALNFVERGLVKMPATAYRWVHEMREIGDTFQEEGFERDMFYGAAEVYRTVAEDSILGQEHVSNRVRGQTVEDVTELMHQAVSRKEKTD